MSGARRSWVEGANDAGCGFPLDNLPFCGFQTDGGEQHLGVGIGDSILDLAELARSGEMGSVSPALRQACEQATLNELMACGREQTTQLRDMLRDKLGEDAPQISVAAVKRFLRPTSSARFCVPVAVGDYTDFYASIHHATNVGKLFRPDQPLMPNYKWVPIGYHGRASSIVVSGTPVRRPSGQTKPPSADAPTFGPSRQMDYELELGVYVGAGNVLGYPIGIDEAEQHIFGVSLVNDWSARDIQAWEYQPLGPFLGKSFATSISPWVVTLDALEPYRVAGPAQDPPPLPYLQTADAWNYDVDLRVELQTAGMRESGAAEIVSRTNFRHMYWNMAQQLAHASVNGTAIRPGDLYASGTISGNDPASYGSFIELTWRGAKPLQLKDGEQRGFLVDGDTVTLRGSAHAPGKPRIGFGKVTGTILPAPS